MRTTVNHIGKYELKAVLARTPLSTVYDGWDSDIARRVAIKLMPLSSIDNSEAGEAFARFKRGAQAAGQLNHPNIVGVYDYGETEDYAYLVMEFVNGPTLKSVFDDNHRFALPDICRIVGSILEALQYSHDHGVVHRDVKPANIMFTKENHVKITDFGIARLEDSEMTQAGMVIGTPAYMSPEQFLGEKIDLRTDIYSTGVVLYHLLTGERPYEGNLTTIMHKVLYGSPVLPSRVSTLVTPVIDAIVTRAMARNREDRFRNAAEFNEALQAARRPGSPPRPPLAAAPTPARRRPAWRTPSSPLRSSSSRTVGIGALIACVSVIGGALGWTFLRSPATHSSAPGIDPEAARQAEAARQEEAARQQQEAARQAEAARQEETTRQQREAAREAARQEEEARQQQQAAARQAELARQEEAARQQQQAARQAELARQQDMARQQQQAAARQAELARQQEAARQQQQAARQTELARQQDAARQQQAARQADLARQQEAARQQQQQAPHQEEPAPQAEAPQTRYAVTSIGAGVGLVCQSVTAENAGKFGLDSAHGMVVKGVAAGSAAERAGIRQGDIILKIKGSEANNLSVLTKIMAADAPAGQTIPIDIFRDGAHQLLQLHVDELRH
jgi:serine/threonine protein kinase